MNFKNIFLVVLVFALTAFTNQPPKKSKLQLKVEDLSEKVISDVIEWRHHLHQYPELSNREYKTAEYIAAHLKKLGLEVQTGIAHTGVVGILKGGKPGPVVGLRADIDALPVPERVDLPWASKAKGEYNGVEVPVMHACGHDVHTAILMGTAEVLVKVKSELRGTVKFIFQPAEEGAPKGEEGGAKLMVEEGVLKNPDVEAIFGLHISAGTHIGKIGYRPGGTLASVNTFEVTINGKQTHGSQPWAGVDPIVTAAQIVNNVQTIVSRNLPLINGAAVISFGSIHGGVRSNIIPEEVKMVGTIRLLDENMRPLLFRRLKEIVENTAASNGATADLEILDGYPVTYNDEALTAKMVPTLKSVMGDDKVQLIPAITGAEDFSFYQKEIPGFFFFLGGTPLDTPEHEAAPHHTPDFYVDDSSMVYGIKAMSRLVVDYMNMK
ncbi:MAG: amidohydrolase [Bacteroidota bacterium]